MIFGDPYMYIYDVWEQENYKIDIWNIAQNFSSCHQLIQMPLNNRIFVTGGVNQDQSLKCFELKLSETKSSYAKVEMCQMTFARDFHSMCYLDENTLFVTGSRRPGAEKTVEKYDIVNNSWSRQKDMRTGRSRHSSCGFAQKDIYVFCGWVGKERSDGIERLSTTVDNAEWDVVNLNPSMNSLNFEKRTIPGVLQISNTEIIIFGGFGAKHALKDMYVLDMNANTIRKDNKVAEFGMELYYRRAHLADNGDKLFGIDADCSIIKMLDETPYYKIISDFKAMPTLISNEEALIDR